MFSDRTVCFVMFFKTLGRFYGNLFQKFDIFRFEFQEINIKNTNSCTQILSKQWIHKIAVWTATNRLQKLYRLFTITFECKCTPS